MQVVCTENVVRIDLVTGGAPLCDTIRSSALRGRAQCDPRSPLFLEEWWWRRSGWPRRRWAMGSMLTAPGLNERMDIADSRSQISEFLYPFARHRRTRAGLSQRHTTSSSGFSAQSGCDHPVLRFRNSAQKTI